MLDIADCELSETASYSVGRALKKNTTLTNLNLADNNLNAHSIEALLRGILSNKALLDIDLGGNPQISDHLMQKVAARLQRNIHIASESRNSFRSFGLTTLVRAMGEMNSSSDSGVR